MASLAFSPTRPGYLADLRTVVVHGAKELAITGGQGCDVNGNEWVGDGSDNLFTVYESTYEEFTVQAAAHPIHIHVNPLQVQTDNDDWNQPGVPFVSFCCPRYLVIILSLGLLSRRLDGRNFLERSVSDAHG